MKHKGDIFIGQRFVQELYRRFPDASDRKIASMLGCSHGLLQGWRDGNTPGGLFLARGLSLGCDIKYVLIGRKKG